VRWLEHLPGIKRVRIGEVVVHAPGDLEEHLAHACDVRRGVAVRQLGEAPLERVHGFLEQRQAPGL